MDQKCSADDRDGGFTLIELLVVMIVIGILAAIAIPTFLNQRQSAIGSGQVADLRSVADELEGFYVSQDQYPTTFLQSGGQVTISDGSGSGLQRVTVGNTVSYTLDTAGGSNAYCLVATNPRAAGPRVWVSNNGGVQPVGVTGCPF